MGISQEVGKEVPPISRLSSALGRIVLQRGPLKLWVEPDGTVAMLHSSSEGRALFGGQALSLFKIQAGVTVTSGRVDWAVSTRGGVLTFEGGAFDGVKVSQKVELRSEPKASMLRRVSLRNATNASIRVRLIRVEDPTGANSLRSGTQGAVGANAFVRGATVAIDEMADPPCGRALGASPSPTTYLTVEAARPTEILKEGLVPGAVAGMTGQVIVIQQTEFDIAPMETREVCYSSVYALSGMEDALSESARLLTLKESRPPERELLATSDWNLNAAAASAVDLLTWSDQAETGLDALEKIPAVGYVVPEVARKFVESARLGQRRDGSLPLTGWPALPGLLETSVYLKNASQFALSAGDKKYARSIYPSLKKAGKFLTASAERDGFDCGRDAPQGWRRLIVRGFPTGTLAEVSFAAVAALSSLSELSHALGKEEDASAFNEASRRALAAAERRLVDKSGRLALNVDTKGIPRMDATVDQAVACYRLGALRKYSGAISARLRESDFETGFGPRTVPTSNPSYFSGSYCEGQLGGYWTRAALAHAISSYSAGLTDAGSESLASVSRLVAEDSASFGTLPGTFPLWLDVEKRKAHGQGSDTVAASRLIEAILLGEAGVARGWGKTTLAPPQSSRLAWAAFEAIRPGEESAAFLGRWEGGNFVASSGPKIETTGLRFGAHEKLRLDPPGLWGCVFYGGGQVVCVGSSLDESRSTQVAFAPRDPALMRGFRIAVERFSQATGEWAEPMSAKLGPKVTFPVELAPHGWSAFRVSSA